jgi:signal peptidase II
LRVLFVSLFVVAADQLTKFLVKGLHVEWLGINFAGMPYGSSKQVFGNFVKITFIENPGMAFGIDVGPKMFLTIFTIGASLVILYYIYKHRHDGILLRLSLAFILAGALGNLMDRTFYGLIYSYAPLFHGRVVDFVQVEFWDFTFLGRTYTTWPIFNVADVSVTCGFLIILLFHKKIFKQEDEPVPVSAEGSNLPQGGLPEGGSPQDGLPSEENKSGEDTLGSIGKINNGTSYILEAPKQNPDTGAPGAEEVKDR